MPENNRCLGGDSSHGRRRLDTTDMVEEVEAAADGWVGPVARRPDAAAPAPDDRWVEALERAPGWEQRIPWDRMRNRPLTLREQALVREFYAGAYQDKSKYNARHPWHVVIGEFRHLVAQTVFGDLGKVLDGGCASGEIVSAFRRNGTECWGFDVCPDLLDIVYPEARPYVRMGRMDAIPFSADEGFKTLVTYDVIEHVPIDCLERLPDELVRLGITQIAAIISNDTLSEGHMTIQDLPYFERLFERAGFRLIRELTGHLNEVPAPVAYSDELDRVIWRPYFESGSPRNGWNQVPGHLFFVREGSGRSEGSPRVG